MAMTLNANTLGYDPRPDLSEWRGTPIPPVHQPLLKTPQRWAIASRVWWHGPPWSLLRNASWYLYYVMDYAEPDDLAYTVHDIPKELWLGALDEAAPGLVSKGSYLLWSLLFGRLEPGARCAWSDRAHRLDYRPLANDTKETMIARHTGNHQ